MAVACPEGESAETTATLEMPGSGDTRSHYGLVHAVARALAPIGDERTIIATDVGQHQMWEAQYYRHETPRSLITSGGLGTMGFALPAAIGAKLARPEAEFRFDTTGTPEFDRWRWVDYWQPVREVIYFKRPVYVRALQELAALANPQGVPPFPEWWPAKAAPPRRRRHSRRRASAVK